MACAYGALPKGAVGAVWLPNGAELARVTAADELAVQWLTGVVDEKKKAAKKKAAPAAVLAAAQRFVAPLYVQPLAAAPAGVLRASVPRQGKYTDDEYVFGKYAGKSVVQRPGKCDFFLHVAFTAAATFAELDELLQHVWMRDPCGHLTQFKLAPAAGAAAADDAAAVADLFPFALNALGLQRRPRVLDNPAQPLVAHLRAVGARAVYEFDFGTTSCVDIEVLALSDGAAGGGAGGGAAGGGATLKVLARNTLAKFVCEMCSKAGAARVIDEYTSVCDACGGADSRARENSPRFGICGYDC